MPLIESPVGLIPQKTTKSPIDLRNIGLQKNNSKNNITFAEVLKSEEVKRVRNDIADFRSSKSVNIGRKNVNVSNIPVIGTNNAAPVKKLVSDMSAGQNSRVISDDEFESIIVAHVISDVFTRTLTENNPEYQGILSIHMRDALRDQILQKNSEKSNRDSSANSVKTIDR